MKSYDYAQRSGVLELAWDDIAQLNRRLAEGVERHGVDLVVGIARAGLFPATAVACALRRDLFPVRLTRREGDTVVRETPVWKVPVPEDVAGKRVVVVDEMADTGDTLRLAAAEVARRGARAVVTAALVSHSWAEPMPEIVALTTDALVLFPWDQEVLVGGRWVPHPELESALVAQQRPSVG